MNENFTWFDELQFNSLNNQQTYVTKQDFLLLNKKIVATELIVNRYLEAKKALQSLQNENDQLKQRLDHVTNECCLFGKQIAECTDEYDALKRDYDLLNEEKNALQKEFGIIKDQNTAYYHELMVMDQYHSLKGTNEQLRKELERCKKEKSKLNYKLQQSSYNNTNDPYQTETALKVSMKSIRELKLALGRLVNFLHAKKIAIPTSLYIRSILKAHTIDDDFMEMEGEFTLRPTEPIQQIKSGVTLLNNQDENDVKNNDDFIDVQPTMATQLSQQQQLPMQSKSKSQKSPQKQMETKKRRKRPTKGKRHTKDETDDLINELKNALSQYEEPEKKETATLELSALMNDFFGDFDTHGIDADQQPVTYVQPPIIDNNAPKSFSKLLSGYETEDEDAFTFIDQRQPKTVKTSKENSGKRDGERKTKLASVITQDPLLNITDQEIDGPILSSVKFSSAVDNEITNYEQIRMQSFFSDNDKIQSDSNSSNTSTIVYDSQKTISKNCDITRSSITTLVKTVNSEILIENEKIQSSITKEIVNQQLQTQNNRLSTQIDILYTTEMEDDDRKEEKEKITISPIEEVEKISVEQEKHYDDITIIRDIFTNIIEDIEGKIAYEAKCLLVKRIFRFTQDIQISLLSSAIVPENKEKMVKRKSTTVLKSNTQTIPITMEISDTKVVHNSIVSKVDSMMIQHVHEHESIKQRINDHTFTNSNLNEIVNLSSDFDIVHVICDKCPLTNEDNKQLKGTFCIY
ncbi:unnamed protein product [Didymodactylos carnosus]|uniref:Uncharacterized protein n=1 Tax=Didymodactylos carnosus TaxID=1234261 RepID=A0A814E513_9BILA|nr:unnamed protein product [Didymodactylos carnosus]CAF3738142.1 unnamed protein product [Didymodactylos carnosus]